MPKVLLKLVVIVFTLSTGAFQQKLQLVLFEKEIFNNFYELKTHFYKFIKYTIYSIKEFLDC